MASFEVYPFIATQGENCPMFYMKPSKYKWMPHFVLTYRSFGKNKTVICGSCMGSHEDILNPPWNGEFGATRNPVYKTQVPGSFISPFVPNLTYWGPFQASLEAVPRASPSPVSVQSNFQNRMEQYSRLAREQQFNTNWSGHISYVRARTTDVQWAFGDYSIPTRQTQNMVIQGQCPYPPWSRIPSSHSSAFQSLNYLQLEASIGFGDGLSFHLEYQCPHGFDDAGASGGPKISTYSTSDYGNNQYTERHLLVSNFICELPFGKGKPWPSDVGKLGVIRWPSAVRRLGRQNPEAGRTGHSTSRFHQKWGGGRPAQVHGETYHKCNSHSIIGSISWINPSAFLLLQVRQRSNFARNGIFALGRVTGISVLRRTSQYRSA